VKVQGKVHIRTDHEVPEGSGDVVLLVNLDPGWGWVVNATCRLLYLREWPGTYCTGDWLGLRVGLDGRGRSHPPSGIRSSDRPARSESLYRLRYPYPHRAAVLSMTPVTGINEFPAPWVGSQRVEISVEDCDRSCSVNL